MDTENGKEECKDMVTYTKISEVILHENINFKRYTDKSLDWWLRRYFINKYYKYASSILLLFSTQCHFI